MQPLNPSLVQQRYGQAVTDLVARFPDGYAAGTSTPAQPFDASFPRAEIFMGSHCDSDPKTQDRVEVWSSRREADGSETILRETFVQEQMRTGLLLRKTDVLTCYTEELSAPGNVFRDAALCSIDLRTGKVRESMEGESAATYAVMLCLDQDPKEYNRAMPPAAPAGFTPTAGPAAGRPEAPPHPAAEEVKRQVDALRAPRDKEIREEPGRVVIGDVELDTSRP